MAPIKDQRAAVTRAIDELQNIKVGPQHLGEDAVNIQRIQALLTGVQALALLDLVDAVKAQTNVISSNA